MKIFGTSVIPANSNQQQPKVKPSFSGQQGHDTFIRTTVNPDMAKAILEDQTLLDKYTTFMRDAFFKLIEAAQGLSVPKTEDKSAEQQIELENKNREIEKQAQTIDRLSSENEKLKAENTEIKEKLHSTLTKVPLGYSEGVGFKYPKKVGVTKKEKQLIELTESIKYTESARDMLQDVIIKMHEKDKEERSQYIERLYEDIGNKKFDAAELEKTIQNYHDELYSEVAEKSARTVIEQKKDEQPAVALQKVVFPARKGHMSDEQKELKSVVEALQMPAQSAEKLTKICEELLKSYRKDPKSAVAKKELTHNLLSALVENKNDVEKLSETVENYHSTIFPEASKPVETTKKAAVKEEPEVEIYRTESETEELKKPNIVGQIDLSKVRDFRKERKMKKEGLEKQTAEPAKVEVSAGKEGTKHVKPIKIASSKRPYIKTTPYDREFITNFMVNGTAPSMKNIITLIKKEYKSLIGERAHNDVEFSSSLPHAKNGSIEWMRAPLINEKATEEDIIKELGTRKKEHAYDFLNQHATVDIADAINRNPMFKSMFTIHSAMRFLDRFVDFNSPDPTKQAGEALKFLQSALQKAVKEGIDLKIAIDRNTKKPGAEITIPASCFHPNARCYFAEKDIVLVLGENAQPIGQYDRSKSQGIIATIYAKTPKNTD